jgi:hypothetical protein
MWTEAIVDVQSTGTLVQELSNLLDKRLLLI